MAAKRANPQTGRAKVGRSAQRDAKLFAALGEGMSISAACLEAGYKRRTVFQWKTDDKDFAAAFLDADEQGADALEDEARRRAVEGVDEPVFFKGEECGKVRRYSDTLLIFLLNGKRPEKYRNRVSAELTGKDGTALQTAVVILPSNGRETQAPAPETPTDGSL